MLKIYRLKLKPEKRCTKRRISGPSAALLPVVLMSVLLLNACVSAEDQVAANSVITALPQEVQGCTFLGNVDSRSRASIGPARFELKLQTAALGGTHLVETLAFPQLMGAGWDFGTVLSGRAYRCPEGLGPKVEKPQARLSSPELPTPPSVNMGDDDWL